MTVNNTDDLIIALNDFCSGSTRFNDFLKRTVMEKYIGPLDGENLNRNLEYIYDLLKKCEN